MVVLGVANLNKFGQQVLAVLNVQESIQYSKAYYLCDDSNGLDNIDESLQGNFKARLGVLRAKSIDLNVGMIDRKGEIGEL